MTSKKEIKQLLEFYTAIKRPYGVLLDMLVAAYPRLRKLSNLRSSIGKPNKKFTETVGYDGFELGLWANSLFKPDWKLDKKGLARVEKSPYKFPRFHACFEMLPKRFKGIHLNLASDDIESNIKALRSHIEVARAGSSVKQPLLVIHPGYVKSEDQKREGIRNLIKTLNTVIPYAEEKNVILGLENLLWNSEIYYMGVDIDEIVEVIDAVNSKYLKSVFDWGHLNTSAYAHKVSNPTEFINDQIKKLGKRIAHVHLNYNSCCEEGYKEYVPSYKKFFNTFVGSRPQEKEGSVTEVLDQHLPITAATGKYREQYTENLLTIFNHSDIFNYGGYITHEVDPKQFFGIIPFNKRGAGLEEHVKDINYIKKVVSKL